MNIYIKFFIVSILMVSLIYAELAFENHFGLDHEHNEPEFTSEAILPTANKRSKEAARDISATWKKPYNKPEFEPISNSSINGEDEDFDVFADGRGATVWGPMSPPPGILYTVRDINEKNYVLGRSQNTQMRIVKKCGSYWYQSSLYFKSFRQVKQDNKWNQNRIRLAVATGARSSSTIDITRTVALETDREDYQCPSDAKWHYGGAPDGSLWLADLIMSLIDIVSGNFKMSRRGLQILDADVNGIARGWNTVASDCATTYPPEVKLIPSQYAVEDGAGKRFMYKVFHPYWGYLIAECNGDALWFDNNPNDPTYVAFNPVG